MLFSTIPEVEGCCSPYEAFFFPLGCVNLIEGVLRVIMTLLFLVKHLLSISLTSWLFPVIILSISVLIIAILVIVELFSDLLTLTHSCIEGWPS